MAIYTEISLSKIEEFNRMDSEFYKPEYIEYTEKLKAYSGIRLTNIATITDGIHESPQINTSGVQYISAKCVKDNEFITDNCVFITQSQNMKNPRTQLREGDVIITSVGTIGNTAVVESDLLPSNCDRHVGIIRVNNKNEISPYYLATFLNSKYGRFQSLREAAGNVQLNLYVRNIGFLIIPRFGDQETQIATWTNQAYKLRNESKKLYSNAQDLLEKELGLDELQIIKTKTYESSFSKVLRLSRADAEYHNPILREYYKKISTKHSLEKITSSAKVLKFSNPDYATNGIPIITQKHLESITPSGYGSELLSSFEWANKNSAAVLKQDDLLFYS